MLLHKLARFKFHHIPKFCLPLDHCKAVYSQVLGVASSMAFKLARSGGSSKFCKRKRCSSVHGFAGSLEGVVKWCPVYIAMHLC